MQKVFGSVPSTSIKKEEKKKTFFSNLLVSPYSTELSEGPNDSNETLNV